MTMKNGFQTEIEFELPKGFVDDEGNLHRQGTMRLATAADEILPLRDPRVRENEAYLAVIVLSRVITRLGGLEDLHTGIIENLFASDLAFLQQLYEDFNSVDPNSSSTGATTSSNGNVLRRYSAVGEG